MWVACQRARSALTSPAARSRRGTCSSILGYTDVTLTPDGGSSERPWVEARYDVVLQPGG